MDWLAPLSRHIFIPLYDYRADISGREYRAELKRSQYFSEAEIRDGQWRRLRSMLEFVYQHNEFYAQRFKSLGLLPDDIKSWDDYAKIPILSKDDIRTCGEQMISRGFSKEKMHYKRTGGSTGVPLRLYVDVEAFRFKNAITARHNSWAGLYPGNRQAALWGDTDKTYSWKERLFMALHTRAIYLDTLKMDEAIIISFVEKLRKLKPKTLMGHGHSLYYFARFLKDKGIDDIKFRGIISTAENLSPDERAVVEDVFGPVVFDRYGCEELSLIASECEHHDGLHISAEGLYLEVINTDNSGIGDLVITDLRNQGMPFIRYEIGDRAFFKNEPCGCGRGLPRLGKIMGRVSEFLFAPDGRRISGISILDTFAIHIPGFKQVQIIQDKRDHIIFKIVKDGYYTQGSLEILRETVIKVFGAAMKYDVEFVDKIPMTARGKYQFSICKIDQPDK